MSDLKESRKLVWKFCYNYSWLFSATSVAPADFNKKKTTMFCGGDFPLECVWSISTQCSTCDESSFSMIEALAWNGLRWYN